MLNTASSVSAGDWLSTTIYRRLWGRHAGIDSPFSVSGPALPAGWHTLVQVWDGREVRQYVNGIRTSTTAVTATGAWTLRRLGRQYFTSQRWSRLTCRASARSAGLGRCHGRPLEREPARDTVAGSGCSEGGGGR